jgi:hypothetical protein
MTDIVGGLMQAADYNSLQASVAKILGNTYDPANPSYNYGLTTQINSSQIVQVNGKFPRVSAADWTNLQLDILAAAAHQGTTSQISALVSQTIATGARVRAADQTAFVNAINVIRINRNLASTVSSYDPGLTNSRTTTWGSPAKTTVTHSFTLTWPDSNSARYFFNMGSIVQFAASRSGGSAGWAQNANWTSALSAMGTISYGINGCFGQSGGTVSSNVGWYNLTNVNQQIFTKAGSSGSSSYYLSNDYTIYARCNVASNATGTANSVTFTINFNDDGKNSLRGYDFVDGTLTSTINIAKGTITDNSILYTAPQPTATQGTILSA